MKINEREKKLLWLTALVGFALFNYLVVWDWIGSFFEGRKKLTSLRQEVRLQEETVSRIPEWEDEIKTLKEQTGGGDGKEDTDWLRRLEATAKKSGLSLASQRPIPEKKTPFGAESGVNLSIDANQEALVKFLFALQQDQANPQVQVLQITPENPSQDKLRIETTIMVVRFTL